MDKFFWNYIAPLIFVALSFGFCYDYVVKMYNLKNQQVGADQQVEREEYEDLTSGYYTITYNLDGGTTNNPDKYNLFTETFTLNNPTKQGYEFIGWTNETLTEPTLTVTICQGSSGNIEFTANYELLIETPVITLFESELPAVVLEWQEVENAEMYYIYNNGKYYDFTTDLSYLFHIVNNDVVGSFTFNIVAVRTIEHEKVLSAFSNEITVNMLESPTVKVIEKNKVTWNQVPEATSYIVKFSNGKIETTNTTINISDYYHLLSDEYFQDVKVYAVNENSTSMPGSQTFTYESAVINTTITIPYTINVKYELYPEEEQIDYTYNGVYLGIKYADVTISFENNGKTYSLTQICTKKRNAYDSAWEYSTPLKTSDMQNLAEWMSFDECTFNAETVGDFIWHLDNKADDYYHEATNSQVTVDLGYYGTDWRAIEVTTQGKTGFPAHLVYTFVVEQYA